MKLPITLIKVPSGITRTGKSALIKMKNPVSVVSSRVEKIKSTGNAVYLFVSKNHRGHTTVRGTTVFSKETKKPPDHEIPLLC